MSSVENTELRRLLEEMTFGGGEPVNHRGLLVGISKKFPNTIQPLESNLPEGCYTCGMHVLNLSENKEYIKIAGFGFPQVYAGRIVFEWLPENHLLQEVDEAQANENDLIMYFDHGKWRHVGFWKLNGRVESKWGAGLLYNHGRWEVPTQYGETVRFFRSIASETAIAFFYASQGHAGFRFLRRATGTTKSAGAPVTEEFEVPVKT